MPVEFIIGGGLVAVALVVLIVFLVARSRRKTPPSVQAAPATQAMPRVQAVPPTPAVPRSEAAEPVTRASLRNARANAASGDSGAAVMATGMFAAGVYDTPRSEHSVPSYPDAPNFSDSGSSGDGGGAGGGD